MSLHTSRSALIAFCAVFLAVATGAAQSSIGTRSASANSPTVSGEISPAQLMQPEELVLLLRSVKTPKPLVLQVGFRVLYVQAHIPGSEYVAAASSQDGIAQLRERVQKVPRTKAIVLYCGCCPWSHCPNVRPAYAELRSMGFSNVKVLYIARDFGTDWVSKGYPVESGP